MKGRTISLYFLKVMLMLLSTDPLDDNDDDHKKQERHKLLLAGDEFLCNRHLKCLLESLKQKIFWKERCEGRESDDQRKKDVDAKSDDGGDDYAWIERMETLEKICY